MSPRARAGGAGGAGAAGRPSAVHAAQDAQDKLDARLMARALREARKGDPSPNPHVGAVVARGSRILSVGHHARCGGPHAEIVALDAAASSARGTTLYVTFEPCNHFGRTPPCTDAIIASGVARVVVGCRDPAPHRKGSAAKLRRAGIELTLGVREREAMALIADFAKHHIRGLPFVTLKAALTLDGRIAASSGDSKWISSEPARREAHRMRAYNDAVLVGVGTVLRDDPELTVRMARGRNPLRVVLDGALRTPPGSRIADCAEGRRTLIFHAPSAPRARKAALSERGVMLCEAPLDDNGKLALRSVLAELAQRDVVRLMVEGGSQVHGAFLAQRLADRVALVLSPRLLADSHAIGFAAGPAKQRISETLNLSDVRYLRLGPDLLVQGALETGAFTRTASKAMRNGKEPTPASPKVARRKARTAEQSKAVRQDR